MKRILLVILYLAFFANYLKSQNAKLELNIVSEDALPINKTEFQSIASEIYQYECSRINFSEDMNVTVKMESLDEGCRGMIKPDSIHIMYLSKDSIKTLSQLKGVFAHELGHIIHFTWINSRGTNNMYWDEGFASWLAGKYYLEWHGYPSYKEALRVIFSANSVYNNYSIINNLKEKTHTAPIRDILYIQWASFIDFLIDKYGLKCIIDLTKLFIEEGAKYNGGYFIELPRDKANNNQNTDINKIIHEMEKKNEDKTSHLKDLYKKIFETSYEELINQWKLINAI